MTSHFTKNYPNWQESASFLLPSKNPGRATNGCRAIQRQDGLLARLFGSGQLGLEKRRNEIAIVALKVNAAAMASAQYAFECDVEASFAVDVGHAFGLIRLDCGVLFAVNDEQWWVVFGDVKNRARQFRQCNMFTRGPAQ